MNTPLVEILIPTWQRAEKVAKCINCITKSTYRNYQITILPDSEGLLGTGRISVYLPYLSKQTKMILLLSDDMELEPECLERMVKCMLEYFPDLDGAVAFNQYNLRMAEPFAIALIGHKFLKRFPNNQCLCKDYFMFYGDTELQEYAISINKFKVCTGARVFHNHPALDSRQIDSTHWRSRKYQGYDNFIRHQRLEAGLLWGKSFKLLYRAGRELHRDNIEYIPDGLKCLTGVVPNRTLRAYFDSPNFSVPQLQIQKQMLEKPPPKTVSFLARRTVAHR